MKKFNVAILGATGAVGQRFIQLLEGHPWFTIGALCASDRSEGKTYAEAATWRLPTALPETIKAMRVHACTPDGLNVDFAFSALPSDSAKTVEPAFAEAGIPVVSNASAWRMGEDIPLLIPEVNPEHTAMIEVQRKNRGWKGYIVTNPNCATIGLVPPLKALHDAFGVEKIMVTTMQATSGAGYPGPPIEVIGDNVVPFINGEEDKIETEPQKLLGKWDGEKLNFAEMVISSQATRVHVSDGHLESVSFSLREKPSVDEVIAAMASFTGIPQEAGLPFAPKNPVIVSREADRPQPKLDRDAENGMAVTVGRVRECPLLGYKMMVLSHNTVRGAAGAAILNAELLAHQGYL